MTTTTPGELLALADEFEAGSNAIDGVRRALIVDALRLAIKPADEGVREALRNIVDAWDAFEGMQLQLDEGLEQAVKAGRFALSAPGANK